MFVIVWLLSRRNTELAWAWRQLVLAFGPLLLGMREGGPNREVSTISAFFPLRVQRQRAVSGAKSLNSCHVSVRNREAKNSFTPQAETCYLYFWKECSKWPALSMRWLRSSLPHRLATAPANEPHYLIATSVDDETVRNGHLDHFGSACKNEYSVNQVVDAIGAGRISGRDKLRTKASLFNPTFLNGEPKLCGSVVFLWDRQYLVVRCALCDIRGTPNLPFKPWSNL